MFKMSERRQLMSYLDSVRQEVDAALSGYMLSCGKSGDSGGRLNEAMRYAVFAGGKRVRPVLAILAGEAYGAERGWILPAASALEMVHTFSLVHDDLPALDNDDLRRGQPTLHREFEESTAVLAGDALLNLGFRLLAREPRQASAEHRLRAVQLLAEAVGVEGMIGGQMDDLEAERQWPEDPIGALQAIHRRKTGALITAAMRLGGVYAGCTEEQDDLLRRLGERLGLLFQIVDDILDVEGSTDKLGKTAHKDERALKLTYPSLYGLQESKRRMSEVREEALALAARLPESRNHGNLGDLMAEFVRYLADRDH